MIDEQAPTQGPLPIPPEVQQALDLMKAAMLPSIQHAVAVGAEAQRIDRKGVAFARMQGGGGYVSGWTAAMARAVGGLAQVEELRHLRQGATSGDRTEDYDGRPPLTSDYAFDLRLPPELVTHFQPRATAAAPPAAQPVRNLPFGRPIDPPSHIDDD